MSLKRWTVTDTETGEDSGSLFACSLDCAKFAAIQRGDKLGECQGNEGVDSYTVCEGGCDW